MPRALRICIVGGGSYNWGPTLLTDLAVTPGISGTIVLHDTDPGAAEDLRRLGVALVASTGAEMDVVCCPDLHESLAGADVVVVTITTGGLEATRHDIDIPALYGIEQTVGDTVGPGGLARALRNIPVMVDLATAMEAVCPDAWLLNLTNPMAPLVRAVSELTQIKTVGLCHEVFGVRRALAAIMSVDRSAVDLTVAGVNHLIWLLDVRVGERDAIAELRAHLADGGTIPLKPVDGDHMLPFQDRWQVKLALLAAYGYLPAAGDRHLAEFFPYVLPDGRGPSFGVLPTTVDHRVTISATARAQVHRWVEGTDPLPLERSEEEVADIVAAIASGNVHRAVVNLPNAGQIDNIPRGAAVETMGTIGPTGAHGIAVGDLPPGVLGTVLPHALNQGLIVEAALTGDRALALQALLNDPLTRDLGTAPRLLDELLDAHRSHLPRFFS